MTMPPLPAASEMHEWRFRLRDCRPQLVWALRWELFAFPEVVTVEQRSGSVVAVICNDQPRPGEWAALAREHGMVLEPLARREERLEAA
jgi:hypothetical protein